MATPLDRRSQQYGFSSLESLMDFFSRWIPPTEIRDLVEKSESQFRPRQDSSEAETELQKIQKAEFAIVRRLVDRNPKLF